MSTTTKASSDSPRVRSASDALHLAAMRDDVTMARGALKAGASVNARAKDTEEPPLASGRPVGVLQSTWKTYEGPPGLTALYRAAQTGSAAVVDLLLAKGASVKLESNGSTALTAAAHGGYLQIVRALVKAGADVNQVTSYGMTALDAAMAGKKAKVADYFRGRNAVSKFEALRVIASAYAKRYKGKVKREDFLVGGVPPCRYAVAGTHHRRRLTFRIFDGGCVVEGETLPIAKGAISLKRPADRATISVPLRGPWRWLHVYRDDTMTDREVQAALKPPGLQHAYALGSGYNSLVAVLPKSRGDVSSEATFLFVYGDEDGPDFAGLDARLDWFAKLFPWRGQRVEPVVVRKEPIFSATAYRIRVGARVRSSKDHPPHTFGGTLDPDVKCRNCRTPIHLLLTIDARASGLKLPSLGPRDFRIVYCLNCMSFPGLLYIDYSNPKLRVIRQDKEQPVNHDEPIAARKVTLTRLEPAKQSGSKIGGTPNWIQGPEVPDCARCRTPMAFLAQLRSRPDLSFVDDGTLYTFVCTKCKISASLVQSH